MEETFQIQSPNIVEHIDWYVSKLKFNKIDSHTISKESNQITFIHNDSPSKGEYRFKIRSMDRVFKSLVESGISKIERPPSITFFGTMELTLTDPIGNKIIFYEDL